MAFEALTQAPRTQKLVLGAMALALIWGGGYFLVLRPKQGEIRALQTRLEGLERDVATHRAMAMNLVRFRAEAARLKGQLDAAKSRLPEEKEMPTLFRDISALANRMGLEVVTFQPKEPQGKDFYSEIPILFSVEGSFHTLGMFLGEVSRLPRVVTLSEVKMQALEGKGSTTLKADLTLATYTFQTGLGAKPQEAKTRAK